MSERSLALFDFDGTITSKDSLKAFLIYSRGKARYYWGLILLSPYIALYFLSIVSRQWIKERLITYFFNAVPIVEFDKISDQFVEEKIPQMLRVKAVERINFHLSKGDRVIVISASPENWVKTWADQHGCETVATRLKTDNGRITGKIFGKNCQGKEKVHRIKSYLNINRYSQIYTYGDTRGDRPFLALGNHVYYKPFR